MYFSHVLSSPISRFYIISGFTLLAQLTYFVLSLTYTFPLNANLLGVFIFAWIFYECTNINYPISLQVKTKEQKGFLSYLFFSCLKVAGFGICFFWLYIALTYVYGQFLTYVEIAYFHFANNTILESYPILPLFLAMVISYTQITLWAIGILYTNKKEVFCITQNLFSVLWETKMFNTKTFLVQNINKKIDFFIYILLLLGLFYTTDFLILFILYLSVYYDIGITFFFLTFLHNVITCILLLPKVYKYITSAYGKDSLHLLHWNVFGGFSKIVARGVALASTSAVGIRAAEVGTDAGIDASNWVSDSRVNGRQDTRRTDQVMSGIRLLGLESYGKDWVRERAPIDSWAWTKSNTGDHAFSLKEGLPSKSAPADLDRKREAYKIASALYKKAEIEYPYQKSLPLKVEFSFFKGFDQTSGRPPKKE